MLDSFIKRASELSGENYSGYDLFPQMALAQHFGIPTPLLDWTYSPFIAGYFAASDPSHNRDDIVFRIHVATVPRDSRAAPISIKETSDVCFVDTTNFFAQRIVRQFGCFIFQPRPGCLRDQSNSMPALRTLGTWDIGGSRRQILRELELMGITRGSLFHDLDSIARDVREGMTLRADLVE